MIQAIVECPVCDAEVPVVVERDVERNHGYKATGQQKLCNDCETPLGTQVIVSHP